MNLLANFQIPRSIAQWATTTPKGCSFPPNSRASPGQSASVHLNQCPNRPYSLRWDQLRYLEIIIYIANLVLHVVSFSFKLCSGGIRWPFSRHKRLCPLGPMAMRWDPWYGETGPRRCVARRPKVKAPFVNEFLTVKRCSSTHNSVAQLSHWLKCGSGIGILQVN